MEWPWRHKIQKLGSQEPTGLKRPRSNRGDENASENQIPEGAVGYGRWEATDALGKVALESGGAGDGGFGSEWR